MKASCGLLNQRPRNVFADGFKTPPRNQGWQTVSSPKMRRKLETKPQQPQEISKAAQPFVSLYQTFHNPQYQDFRAEAQLYARQRKEALEKAAKAYSEKKGELASFYSDQVNSNNFSFSLVTSACRDIFCFSIEAGAFFREGLRTVINCERANLDTWITTETD